MKIDTRPDFLVTNANANYASQTSTKKVSVKEETATSGTNAAQDAYIPSDPTVKKAGYDNPAKKADAATLARLKQQSEQVYYAMKETVRMMLKSQGLNFLEATDKETGETPDVESGEKSAATTQADAAAAIGAGGALSPEKLSDTIVEFAKSISGGDKNKLGVLRDAIQQGFDEATKAWGKELPDITKKTFDLIQKKLDAWENGTETTQSPQAATTAK